MKARSGSWFFGWFFVCLLFCESTPPPAGADPGISEEEICDNGIDDDGDGLVDADDPDCPARVGNAYVQRLTAGCEDNQLLLSFRICNEGPGELPPDLPWILYHRDPRLYAAKKLAQGDLEDSLAPDSCYSRQLTFSADVGESFFLLINPDLDATPPFGVDAELPFGDYKEAAYDDNFGSLVFSCNRRIFAPTGFSPNNDGVNDLFFLRTGFGIDRIEELKVYNRWGEVVFDAYHCPPNDPDCGWDGNHHGDPAEPAVYVWKARLAFMDGTQRVLHGEVTLMR